MQKPAKMTIFYGNIASGKSTLAKGFAKEGAVVIDSDSITSMVHGGDYTAYSVDYRPIYKAIENITIEKALEMGFDVVVDRCSEHRKTRDKYVDIARRFGAHTHLIITGWHDPKIHAKRRFEDDPRGLSYEVWLGVAENKESSRNEISPDEDFDNKSYYFH
jgi:predicted kinase